ncbi:MAG: PA0069 family radical SAM protein [Pseudomonadota bacterium]
MPLPASTLMDPASRRGRGAPANGLSQRFDDKLRLGFDDGWGSAQTASAEDGTLKTHVTIDASRSALAYNRSPDIPFDRSINPYRGCEHGCIYCFARPSHAYLGLSPGLDFETRLVAKPDAPALLKAEIAAPGYVPKPIALGTNTDPYQPIEKRLAITRAILQVLEEAGHPLTIVTKSYLVTRDSDILTRLAQRRLVKVFLSVTSLDHRLARTMEPRAATPGRRLEAMAMLAKAGIPTGVMVAPVIPALNDHELEWILAAAADAGARSAAHIPLRLPHEVKELFRQWLAEHFPDRAARVMALVRAMRGGRDNDPRFGHRMRGQGAYAAMLDQRFKLACKRYGLSGRGGELTVAHFIPPTTQPVQLSLF